MKPPLAKGRPDDFQTPPIALKPLYPYLPKNWTIWEPAAGKRNLVHELAHRKYKVIGTDVIDKPAHDFLDGEPGIKWDCIITNPPFSLKQPFLERCYRLGKPFALLLPLTTFETAKRQKLFKEYGLEVILFDKRVNFETPNNVANSSSWFATAWFTHGLGVGQQLSFEQLQPDN